MKTLTQLQAELKEAKLRRLSHPEMAALKPGDKVRISFVPKGKFGRVTHDAEVISNQGGSWSYKLDNGKAISQLRKHSHKVFVKENLSEALPRGVYKSKVVVPRNKFNKNEDQAVLDALKKDGRVPQNSKNSGATLVGMKVLDKNAVDVTVVALYTTNRSAALDLRIDKKQKPFTDADYKL